MSSVIEKLAAGGHLTDKQVERIGRRVSEMVKAAREDPNFRKEAVEKLAFGMSKMSPLLKSTLTHVGTGAAVSAGFTGGAAAFNAISQKLQERGQSIAKAKNYKEMLGANPDLRGADVDARMVQRHFDTISKFNPEYAGDPMVAGQYVRSSLNFAAPNLDQLNNVVRARQSYVSARKDQGTPGEKLLKPLTGMASTLMAGSKSPGGIEGGGE